MSEKKGLIQEFKEFLTTGNLMQLAVAFVMGGAVAAVITSFIENIFNGILALFLPKDKTDLSQWTIADDKIKIGSFVNSLIVFVVLAAVVFFLVKAYKKMTGEADKAAGPSEVDLLTEIRDSLKSR